MSEDVDLLAFGCSRVLFGLDRVLRDLRLFCVEVLTCPPLHSVSKSESFSVVLVVDLKVLLQMSSNVMVSKLELVVQASTVKR